MITANQTTLSPAEQSLSNSAPVSGQQPAAKPSMFEASRLLGGLGDVANNLLGSIPGAGLLNAVSSPMPSLTATVTSNPAAKYGDNYIANTLGMGKTGSLQVSSGNAENRALGTPFSWWWVVGAIVIVTGWLFLRRKG